MALYRYKGQLTHYDITEEGIVTNLKTGATLKGSINNHGYLIITITLKSGQTKKIQLHRMLMETFCPNFNSANLTINHIDGNKLNNKLPNLEWCTREENTKKAWEDGLCDNKKQPIYCFNDEKELVGSWASLQDLARMTHYNVGIIAKDCKLEKRGKIYGYYWSFTSDNNFDTIQYPNIGVARPIQQFDLNGNLLATYPSRGAAARKLKINGGHITECCQHRISSYKGYKWEYLK